MQTDATSCGWERGTRGTAAAAVRTTICSPGLHRHFLFIDMALDASQELVFFPAPAETLLTHFPPRYAAERKHIFIRIASTVILFVLLLPYALTDVLRRLRRRNLKKQYAEQEQLKSKDESKLTDAGQNSRKARGTNDEVTPAGQTNEMATVDENIHVVLPWQVWSIFNLFAVLGVLLLVLLTSNNKYGARGVFQAPFFSLSECQGLIQMYDTFSMSDKPLYLDQFPNQNKENMLRIFDSRLGPLIERVYGIVPRALQADKVSYLKQHVYIVLTPIQTQTLLCLLDFYPH